MEFSWHITKLLKLLYADDQIIKAKSEDESQIARHQLNRTAHE
jgi:hypothetical protein